MANGSVLIRSLALGLEGKVERFRARFWRVLQIGRGGGELRD